MLKDEIELMEKVETLAKGVAEIVADYKQVKSERDKARIDLAVAEQALAEATRENERFRNMLILNDIWSLCFNDDYTECALNCNDFFVPAADAEDIDPFKDFDSIKSAHDRFGFEGIYAWISLKRGGANPWREYKRMAEFNAAREALKGDKAI